MPTPDTSPSSSRSNKNGEALLQATVLYDNLSVCVICLEVNVEYAAAILSTWTQQSASCPLCKAQVTSINYRDSSSSEQHVLPIIQAQAERVLRPLRIARTRRRRLANSTGDAGLELELQRSLRIRREVYRQQLYSKHIGNNKYSRFRNLTPEIFRRDAVLQRKARVWLRRELQVFDFLSLSSNVRGTGRVGAIEHVLGYTVAILAVVDVKGSAGQAQELLADFLGRDNACLLLHELLGWLRSPFERVEEWDAVVQY
ncbi:hypothetical protein LTR66_015690 [Elasticomyces elasticus]|nr:hypothetical protein LTR66_015690 [Elasticomyces elasticus]